MLAIAGLLLIAAGIACWATGLDDDLRLLLRLPPASAWRQVVVGLTFLGSLLVMGPIALLAVVILLVRGQRRAAVWLLVTVTSGRLAVEGLKLVITRPRPPIAERLDAVTSWSFPSSHSAGTILTCLALAMLAGTRWALAGALGFAVLIGWSRLALGVHWPGDVLAGWGFAMLWVGVAERFKRPSS
jgi:undecaprenyl-diphosphatase